jgi:hypothetical protein
MLVIIVGGALFSERQLQCFAQEKASDSQQHYKCDSPGIQLEGMLAQRTFYGPPGFGETPAKDARETVLILKLAKPITVDSVQNTKGDEGSCWGVYPNLKQIQVFIHQQDKPGTSKLVGKTVVAVGKLHEGDAPSEHTKVVMDVERIESK